MDQHAHLNGKENELFCKDGKYLIELCSCSPSSNGMVTHFVSFDATLMEIYDPTNPSGALQVLRNYEDVYLVNETLRMFHNTCKYLTIIAVWKLTSKEHGTGKRSIFDALSESTHKKKRRGKKRN
jgi:hypothetical protein